MIEIRRKQAEATTAPRAVEMPFTGDAAPRAVQGTAQPVTASKRPSQPFTALDGSRNYKRMYRAAHDFHQRNNPPRLDDDGGGRYWAEATEDMLATAARFDNDPFMNGLLFAIFDELEAEFKRLEAGQ